MKTPTARVSAQWRRIAHSLAETLRDNVRSHEPTCSVWSTRVGTAGLERTCNCTLGRAHMIAAAVEKGDRTKAYLLAVRVDRSRSANANGAKDTEA